MAKQINVKFKKLSPDAIIPTKGSSTAAGLDFYSPADIVIKPNESVLVNTDIAWQPSNPNSYLQIKSRSGLAIKSNVEASNAGVIDSDYRGNIGIKLTNFSSKEYQIKKGDRIAQGIVLELPSVSIEEAAELDDTVRSAGGFGSTGR